MTSSRNRTESGAPHWQSRLESWKEIAAYLGRDVRTAIRWERDRGLPVHRVPGGKRQAVFAFPAELDAWLAGRSDTVESIEPPVAEVTAGEQVLPLRRSGIAARVLAATAILASLAAVVSLVAARGRPIAGVTLQDGAIVAVDAGGREQWRHALEAGTSFLKLEFQPLSAGSDRPHLLVLLTSQPVPTRMSDRLLLFSQDGKLLWSVEPDDVLRFAGGEYGPPWFSGSLTSMTLDGSPRVLWAVRHVTWWPAMLLSFDGGGGRAGTFVNAGWIHSVVPDGDRILISGVSNSADAGMAALLDGRRPSGRSPESPGSPYYCAACPPAPPLKYVTLGRSELNRAGGHDINMTSILRFERGIQLRTLEASPSGGEAVYEVTPDFSIASALFGDRYWDLHRRYEHEGRVSHAAAACPERAAMPPVRIWSAEAGWRDHSASR